MEKIKKLLLLAILIRIIIMPFLYHPDIRVYHSQVQYLKEGVVNIYPHLENIKNKRHFKEEFVYFPVAYIFLGSYQVIVNPIMGKYFDAWLNGAESVHLYRYLFILKLPYLFLDIGIAFILMKLVKKEDKEKVLTLWLFNPFTIFIIYAFSNIDIIPVFFTLLALYFLKKDKGLKTGLSLVLGALVKAYPMILLPSLLLTKEHTKKKAINLTLALFLFFLALLPFWGDSFVTSAFSSGLTNKIFEFGIDVGLPRKIPYFLILYAAVFAREYFAKNSDIIFYFIASLLMLIAFVDYHIQWILWFAPFLTLLIIKNRKLFFPSLLVFFFAIIPPLLVNDKYLTVALFASISEVFTQASTPYLFLSNIVDPGIVINVSRWLFLAVTISYIAIYKFNEYKSK